MDVLRATALIAELPRERTRLLDNLGRLRREVGPITPELSDSLADHMNVRRGEVHEVVSFYSFLQVPVDAVRVCTGPVCDCLGGRELLGANPGALEVPCLGHCDLAPVMTRGDTIVRGAAELRVKETDRIETVTTSLKALGVRNKASDDGFRVRGVPSRPKGGGMGTHGDHRLAMLGAVAGLVSREGVRLEGAEAVAISFPGFFDLLESVTQR